MSGRNNLREERFVLIMVASEVATHHGRKAWWSSLHISRHEAENSSNRKGQKQDVVPKDTPLVTYFL
jgi:hypothetical protein